jgi:hypothetical protein
VAAQVDPADWKRELAKVTGRFIRCQHRVSTRELLERLCVPIPASDKTVKQLRPIMHELGWHGPRMLRFDKKTLNGYWRPPTVGGVFSPDVDDFDFGSDALATAESLICPRLRRRRNVMMPMWTPLLRFRVRLCWCRAGRCAAAQAGARDVAWVGED